MATRYYSNTASAATLSASVTAAATIMTVDVTTGWPVSYPFTLVIDPDTASEELVSVTAVAGTTLTVERGYDNTTGVAHSPGAVVQHVHSAADFADSRDHEAAASGVHGVTGSLVGTSDAQVLTNKDLSSATNTFPADVVRDADLLPYATDADLSAHTADTSAHGVAGDVVGTTDTQTLTNKNLTSATNTFPATLATTASVTAVSSRVTTLENAAPQAGARSCPVAAADTRYTVSVTFPTAFSAPPIVVCNPAVTYAETAFASPTNVTATGFTMNYRRTIVGDMTVNWIAVPA